MSALSIIVPVLNEAAQLEDLLAHLSPYRERGCELIFVDGGSEDDTLTKLESAGWLALSSPRGRAVQMNTGANRATKEVLLFLHADTRLPTEADALISAALNAQNQRHWGRFDVTIVGLSAMLPVIAFFMNWRSRLTGVATGDQCLFVRRSSFLRVGGFPAIVLMEDVAMSKLLKRLSRPICLRSKVRTSGRRWIQGGVWKTIVLMWRLRLQYWLGADPAQLAKAYRSSFQA